MRGDATESKKFVKLHELEDVQQYAIREYTMLGITEWTSFLVGF
jgi:hypothetical protein